MTNQEKFPLRTVKAIVAVDLNRGIGIKGDLPWHIPEDLKYFSKCTKGHAVLMGRNTWDSLKPEYKPLPYRLNIVCSRTPEKINCPLDVVKYDSTKKAIDDFRNFKLKTPTDTLWIVGGAQIYAQTLNLLDELYLTQIYKIYNADTYFPEYEGIFSLVSEDKKDATPELPAYSFKIFKQTLRP